MGWKWFVQTDNGIEGPLSTDEVHRGVQSGQLLHRNLIWGNGNEKWQNLELWSQELPGLNSAEPQEINLESWHFAVNGQSRGPMSRAALLVELKTIGAVAELMVWTKGMKEWAPLFEFHDLLSELGVNKRQFPRADITGKVILKDGATTLIASLLSISEGGFGLALSGGGLVGGQVVSAELQCAQFRDPLHVKAEVRYVHDGTVGLKFTQISVENRGAIIQYIRQHQVRFQLKAA